MSPIPSLRRPHERHIFSGIICHLRAERSVKIRGRYVQGRPVQGRLVAG